ncbi:MAG TPA: TonB-dependent receptor plug domain-containing protein [Holophaga sp.]|nr:TonB-dependent receptor plug domain-containing protein [Holophaga sp.]
MRRSILPLCALSLAAQTPQGADAIERDLLALLSTPVTVASRTAMTTRETPGVVSLITREEIQAMGARDLIDVLRMVPGMDFGYDVQGVVGPSMRGLWGYEGKLLLIWDGVEMNEPLFGTTQFGNHYPVDQIKRVEVIRGPGSSMYGGNAEVAVVQVTTLSPSESAPGGAGVMAGRGRDAWYRKTAQAVAGYEGADVKVSLGLFGGTGVRSDGTYTSPDGSSYGLADNSQIRPIFANLGVEAWGVKFRAIVDQYYLWQRDNISAPTPAPTGLLFGSTNLDARYDWQVTDRLTVTPFATWRDFKSWWTSEEIAGAFMYPTTRFKAGASAVWEAAEGWTLAGGAEGFRDESKVRPPTVSDLPGGGDSVAYTTKAAYGQAQFRGWANVTVGARWESHDKAGSSFVPRFALTKVAGRWHFKILYANSFRTPAIQNINQALFPEASIQPEKTRTAEVEVGYQAGSSLFTLNVFDMHIDRPLVYTVVGESFGYLNMESTGSRGFEAEWKLRQPWGFLNAGFSMARADNKVDYWAVPGHSAEFLGIAPAKATLAAGIRFGKGWTLGPSLVWLASRHAYAYDAGAGEVALRAFPSYLLANATLSWNSGPVTASLGVFDAGDRRTPFFQPYNGGHGPLPGQGREWVAKVRYGF